MNTTGASVDKCSVKLGDRVRVQDSHLRGGGSCVHLEGGRYCTIQRNELLKGAGHGDRAGRDEMADDCFRRGAPKHENPTQQHAGAGGSSPSAAPPPASACLVVCEHHEAVGFGAGLFQAGTGNVLGARDGAMHFQPETFGVART